MNPGPSPRAPLAILGTGAAWLVGLSAANQIVAILFASNLLAVVVIQAVVVDLAIGKAGVRWDPAASDKGSDEVKNAARGIAAGAGVALAVAALVTGAGAALGWAKLALHGPTMSLGFVLVRAIAIGVRDSLLLVGLPHAFVKRAGGVPAWSAAAFSALAGGAAIGLQTAATPSNVALAIALTGAAGALWLRAGSGWAAAGLLGGWVLFAGAVLRGALVDVDWLRGSLAPGLIADGAPAWIAAALFALLAVALVRKNSAPADSPA